MITALVTGASSGIGMEISRKLARRGYRLVIVARDRERLCAAAGILRREGAAQVLPLAVDLARPYAAEEVVRYLRRKKLPVDILVNNAGFGQGGRFWETGPTRIRNMLRVNIEALTFLTRLLLPGMLRRGRGRVLNLASTGGFVPGPYNAVYCATKAYVLSLSRALAVELEGSGVTVTALCPGGTDTRFAGQADMENTVLFRLGVMEPRQVADIGYRAMEKGRSVIVAGLRNKLMMLMVRLAPMDMAAVVSGWIQKNRG